MCEAFWVTEHVRCFWQNVGWKTGPLVPTEFQLNEQSRGETREDHEQTSCCVECGGKNAGILWMKVKVAQSCPTLCNSMDYTGHGILQVRILGWVAFPFSRGSSQLRDRTRVPRMQVDSLPAKWQGKPMILWERWDQRVRGKERLILQV